jgi:hypothetical protein
MSKTKNKIRRENTTEFLNQGFRISGKDVKGQEAGVVANIPLSREVMETIGYSEEEIVAIHGPRVESAG